MTCSNQKVESNARFVTWSDGSLQLVIGNEAFCISEQDAQGIASYLFLRHEKRPKDIEKSASSAHYALKMRVSRVHNKKVEKMLQKEEPYEDSKVEAEVSETSLYS
ncbi:UNVERIFIED_CONTAM: protein LEO1 [Sesamum latifolium]|uniref:Protein LEO1 n=1 Tax=Sesamum latifolium TaxID=2727402 RepID=A0AAW2UGM9_9LAMI